MYQAKTWVTVTVRFFIGLSITLIASSSFIGCECLHKIINGGKKKPPVVTILGQTPPHNQVNILLKNALSDAAIKKSILDAVEPGTLQAELIKIRRCACDPSLLNITLPSSLTIEGADGELVVRTKSNGANGGVDLPLDENNSIGANFIISPFDVNTVGLATNAPPRTTDSSIAGLVQVPKNPDENNTISVAVFDSGLDPSYLPSTTWQSPTSQCLTGVYTESKKGWNFTSNNVLETKDETFMHHGSRVANLIARQFNDSKVTVKIVPMRVLGPDNKGDLFSILCAMATAQKNNIKVFNMSFGYYGEEDNLFRQYVDTITKDGIRLVVAAGNRTKDEEKADRNTTSMMPKFYPAYFSQTNDKVFVATTARLDGGNLLGCDYQNYGPEQVLGVLGDNDCYFLPIPSSGSKSQFVQIYGSSYATPVLTGQLARVLKEHPNKVQGWKDILSSPLSMTQAQGGGQLYQNAYIRSKSVPPSELQ